MTMAEMTEMVLERAGIAREGGLLIAIDGMCASGKSTLGARLAVALDANLFHMDDFFLTPQLRTPERLEEPGGNVDYARFQSEVLGPLANGSAFSYRPFDCSRGAMAGEVRVAPRAIALVEGAYSLHRHFGEPWGLRVFVEVSPRTQMERILARNGEKMLERFLSEWIPMEQRYFAAFDVKARCDLTLVSG